MVTSAGDKHTLKPYNGLNPQQHAPEDIHTDACMWLSPVGVLEVVIIAFSLSLEWTLDVRVS